MIFKKYPNVVFARSKIKDGNMSFVFGDPVEAFNNRNRFLSSLKINPKSTVSLKQIHSNKVLIVNKNFGGIGAFPNKDIIEADAMITNEPNLFLIIKSADCHQIALFDPQNIAIGLIHAGRKGLELGIIKAAIRLMNKNYQTKPSDLLVQLGPSIGPCHYPVDIWADAENQLIDCGLLNKNIDNLKICTYESADYFSHRKAANQDLEDFRFATILGLNHAN